MPNAVFRLVAGMMTAARSAGPRRARAAARAAARASSPRTHTAPVGEALEERRLFVLAVAPLPASAAPATLGATLLVPNTGVTITGGTYVGAPNQGATFTGFDYTAPAIGRLSVQDGVLLTTGQANNALGPNDAPDTATLLFSPGDVDLDALVGLETFDGNSLTLNFTTDVNTRSILFDFIFGSEEYSEFVGSIFNDAFAAYVDGVQVSFDINGRPITVNNNFFRVNNLNNAIDVEYDGLTPRIRTQAPLNPAITNHTLKFVIADTGDTDYDSGVFIGRLQGSPTAVPAPVTDLPNPGILQLAGNTFTVDESGGTASIVVNRVGGTSGQVSVDYAITAGTATDVLDFTAVSGTLFFADAQTTATISVPIANDTLIEGDETVDIALTNAVDAGLGSPSTGTLIILDDERAVQFVPQLTFVDQTAGTAVLTVSRSGPLTGTVAIDYASSDAALPPGVTLPPGVGPVNPAAANSDYIPVSGTLNFAEGQRDATITVPIIDDFEDDEILEAFIVTLSNVRGTGEPTGLGVQNIAGVGIRNVDRPPSIFDITAFAPGGRAEALYLRVNDPVLTGRAIDPANFDLFQHTERRFGQLPSRRRVGLRSVEYDVGVRTITLRPMQLLKNNVFYEVVVRGTTPGGVRGANQEFLDGNLDRSVIQGEDFIGYFGRGTSLQYNDRDGDRIKLGAAKGGVIEVFRDATRDARQVRYVGAVPNSSYIYGTFRPLGRNSDRVTAIGSLLLGSAKNNLRNPPFQIGYTI